MSNYSFYLGRGDMFRLLMQPSSGQLKVEQILYCAHNMGSHIVYIWSTFIHSFSILSDDRSKASSKTMPPHSAI